MKIKHTHIRRLLELRSCFEALYCHDDKTIPRYIRFIIFKHLQEILRKLEDLESPWQNRLLKEKELSFVSRDLDKDEEVYYFTFDESEDNNFTRSFSFNKDYYESCPFSFDSDSWVVKRLVEAKKLFVSYESTREVVQYDPSVHDPSDLCANVVINNSMKALYDIFSQAIVPVPFGTSCCNRCRFNYNIPQTRIARLEPTAIAECNSTLDMKLLLDLDLRDLHNYIVVAECVLKSFAFVAGREVQVNIKENEEMLLFTERLDNDYVELTYYGLHHRIYESIRPYLEEIARKYSHVSHYFECIDDEHPLTFAKNKIVMKLSQDENRNFFHYKSKKYQYTVDSCPRCIKTLFEYYPDRRKWM